MTDPRSYWRGFGDAWWSLAAAVIALLVVAIVLAHHPRLPR